jgi:chemotaxis protein CheY-P-specific phosphatase CheC
MEQQNKTKVIRSMTDANKMLDKGHKIIGIDRDIQNRSFLVFIFEKTDKLMEDLKAITPNK